MDKCERLCAPGHPLAAIAGSAGQATLQAMGRLSAGQRIVPELSRMDITDVSGALQALA